MEYKIVFNSKDRPYRQLPDGTCYTGGTPLPMIQRLERIRANQTRCRYHWGDTTGDTAGRDWGDCYDVEGRIGRSTGKLKIPLLIHNRRSSGGGALLTDCIVKITETAGGKVVYQHPNYHVKGK